jgi:hypothetical protein
MRFVQLNNGFMGIVTDAQSISTLKEKFKLGDVTDFIINEVEDKKKRLVLILSNDNASTSTSASTSTNNIRENLKAIIKKKEKEEKLKKSEIGDKLLHEGININKKSFYPKNYFNNKYHFVNSPNNSNNSSPNNIQLLNSKMNIYNYNNINTIGNKTFSGHFYYNNFNNGGNLVNNGWLYNSEDNNNAYYFEQPDENNSSNNFYYVINKFHDNLPNRFIRQSK